MVLKISGYSLVALIGSGQESLWDLAADHGPYFDEVGAPVGPVEHLAMIKQAGGEKIACLDGGGQIVGWIGLIPKGKEADLAGIGVHRDWRNRGIASILMDAAEAWLTGRNIHRLVFYTSPLLVPNALLYLRRNNASYVFFESSMTMHGQTFPWPMVNCSLDLPRRRNDYAFPASETVLAASVITWDGLTATVRHERLDAPGSTKYLILPYLDVPPIDREIKENQAAFLHVTNEAFRELTRRGYAIAGFGPVSSDWAYAFVENSPTRPA